MLRDLAPWTDPELASFIMSYYDSFAALPLDSQPERSSAKRKRSSEDSPERAKRHAPSRRSPEQKRSEPEQKRSEPEQKRSEEKSEIEEYQEQMYLTREERRRLTQPDDEPEDDMDALLRLQEEAEAFQAMDTDMYRELGFDTGAHLMQQQPPQEEARRQEAKSVQLPRPSRHNSTGLWARLDPRMSDAQLSELLEQSGDHMTEFRRTFDADMEQASLRLLQLPAIPQSANELGAAWGKMVTGYVQFFTLLERRGMMEPNTSVGAVIRKAVLGWKAQIDCARSCLESKVKMRALDRGMDVPFAPDELKAPPKLDPRSSELLRLMKLIYSDGLRVNDGYIMEQIMTPDGFPTHAWQKQCEVHEWVHRQVFGSDNWGKVNASEAHIAHYISRCVNPLVRPVTPNRLVVACNTGLYFLDEDHFVPYLNEDGSPNVEFLMLDSNICAHIYHNVDYKHEKFDDFMEIPNPLRVIFTCQSYTEDEMRFLYGLIGRLFYPVGMHDQYQAILFLLGVAGTGKSSLIESILAMFTPEDKGIVGTRNEDVFGLESLFNKFIVAFTDIRANTNFCAGNLQQMASGEHMQFARKNRTAVFKKWTASTIIAGNEVPTGFADRKGNMSRRMMVALFQNWIKNEDPDLKEKAMASIMYVLRSFNVAYRALYSRGKSAARV